MQGARECRQEEMSLQNHVPSPREGYVDAFARVSPLLHQMLTVGSVSGVEQVLLCWEANEGCEVALDGVLFSGGKVLGTAATLYARCHGQEVWPRKKAWPALC